jgi:hypothetical protein
MEYLGSQLEYFAARWFGTLAVTGLIWGAATYRFGWRPTLCMSVTAFPGFLLQTAVIFLILDAYVIRTFYDMPFLAALIRTLPLLLLGLSGTLIYGFLFNWIPFLVFVYLLIGWARRIGRRDRWSASSILTYSTMLLSYVMTQAFLNAKH